MRSCPVLSMLSCPFERRVTSCNCKVIHVVSLESREHKMKDLETAESRIKLKMCLCLFKGVAQTSVISRRLLM